MQRKIIFFLLIALFPFFVNAISKCEYSTGSKMNDSYSATVIVTENPGGLGTSVSGTINYFAKINLNTSSYVTVKNWGFNHKECYKYANIDTGFVIIDQISDVGKTSYEIYVSDDKDSLTTHGYGIMTLLGSSSNSSNSTTKDNTTTTDDKKNESTTTDDKKKEDSTSGDKKTESTTTDDGKTESSTTGEEGTNYNVKDTTIGEICSMPQYRKIAKFLGSIVNFAKYVIPIVIIAFGVKDLYSAVMAAKDDAIKKAAKSIMFRLAAGVFVFLLPGLVQFFFNMLNDWSDYKIDVCCCSECVLNSNCDVNSCNSKSCKLEGMNS